MEGFPNFHMQVHISEEDFRLFHTMDRFLYTILVVDLLCDPVEALQIMAVWLWLERAGFYNIIQRIKDLPVELISELVDEAAICLKFINNPQFSLTNETNDIHLTQSVISGFSLQYLQSNQAFAKAGVELVHTTICMRAFGDLMQHAILQNEVQRIAHNQQLSMQQVMLSNDFRNIMVPHEQRTMFVTFSKGYPVTESEIRNFFMQNFGDCIESFYMEQVKKRGDQPLYARIVFFQVNMISIILNGLPNAKFTINGKHVWMRKYIPKSQKISMP